MHQNVGVSAVLFDFGDLAGQIVAAALHILQIGLRGAIFLVQIQNFGGTGRQSATFKSFVEQFGIFPYPFNVVHDWLLIKKVMPL